MLEKFGGGRLVVPETPQRKGVGSHEKRLGFQGHARAAWFLGSIGAIFAKDV